MRYVVDPCAFVWCVHCKGFARVRVAVLIKARRVGTHPVNVPHDNAVICSFNRYCVAVKSFPAIVPHAYTCGHNAEKMPQCVALFAMSTHMKYFFHKGKQLSHMPELSACPHADILPVYLLSDNLRNVWMLLFAL